VCLENDWAPSHRWCSLCGLLSALSLRAVETVVVSPRLDRGISGPTFIRARVRLRMTGGRPILPSRSLRGSAKDAKPGRRVLGGISQGDATALRAGGADVIRIARSSPIVGLRAFD
jgi:hypothetical protein